MKRSPALTALVVVALLAASALPVIAAPLPMLPLVIGNRWDYEDAGGNHQVETITGTRTILGRTVFVKSYTVGPDAGLENWWLTGPNGEVLLAGFATGGTSGLSLAYEPPITMCGGAPSLGDLWSTHVVAYNMADMSVFEEYDITYSALEAVVLAVPAGNFPSIGVGPVPTPSPTARAVSGALALDGRLVVGTSSATSASVTDWFSPGVGDVQYHTASLWQLVGYGGITPTLSTTWGALKSRYR